METWQVDIVCPLCGAKSRANRIERHRNRKHPDCVQREFEQLILEDLSQGKAVIDTKRSVKSRANASATNAAARAKKSTKKIRGLVSGGAMGLGKNR